MANNLSTAGQSASVSTPTATDLAKRYKERRDDRYALHDLLVKVSTLPRVKTCHRRPHEAYVTGKSTGPVAGFGGLQTCGSVWSCSLCAPTVRQTRAAELEAMAQLWVTSKKDGGMGGSLCMATFTVSHYLHQRLSDQWAAISKAWTAMISGRFKEEFYEKYQVAGMTIAREVTVGDEHGWHTHLHVLIWFRNTKPSKPNKRKGETVAPDAKRARDLERVLYKRWHDQTTRLGLGAPSRAHGVRVDPIRRGKAGAADIARYVAKVQDKREDANAQEVKRHEWGIGREMTRGDLKSAGRRGDARERIPVLRRHRTPFQVLRDFNTTGEANDLELWNEFEQASLRKRALTWSGTVRGELKDLMALDERTDEEIAAEDALGGEVVWAMPKRVWAQVVCQDGRRGALLQATSEGWTAVVQLAESWGLVVGRDLFAEKPQRPERPADQDESAFDQDEPGWATPPCPDWDEDGLPLPEEPAWLDEPEPEPDWN